MRILLVSLVFFTSFNCFSMRDSFGAPRISDDLLIGFDSEVFHSGRIKFVNFCLCMAAKLPKGLRYCDGREFTGGSEEACCHYGEMRANRHLGLRHTQMPSLCVSTEIQEDSCGHWVDRC